MEDGKAIFTDAILGTGRPVNSQLYELGSQLHARGVFFRTMVTKFSGQTNTLWKESLFTMKVII